MSDENQTNAGTETETPQQQFVIQKIYVKDMSFEAPNSPQSFMGEWKPDVSIDLNTEGKGVADKVYEVILSITVTVKNGDNTAYLVEVQQAGIFAIDGFGEDDLRAMIGSFCPNVLFPYARETISDVVTRGGFPQMLLSPVNFDALYLQHLQEQHKAEGAAEASPAQ